MGGYQEVERERWAIQTLMIIVGQGSSRVATSMKHGEIRHN